MAMTQVGVGPSSHRVPWFLQKRFAGGGVLMDWGIYTAHTILWLMGPVETVYGTSAIFRPEVQVGNELLTDVDVEDTIMATMRFKNGAMGSWYAAWAVVAGHHSMTIDGSQGSIMTHRESPGVNVFSKTFNEPDHLRGWRHLPTVEPPLHGSPLPQARSPRRRRARTPSLCSSRVPTGGTRWSWCWRSTVRRRLGRQ